MHKSNYTKLIADAAHRVDLIITGMSDLINASLHHFNPDVVEAGRILRNRFDAFGRIVRKSYEEETVVVNLLIADLMSNEYAPAVAATGLNAWLTELQAAEGDFEKLFEMRSVETTGKPQGNLKEIRSEIDILYHRMTDLVSAAATLDAAGVYEAFIARLNTEITYFNDHYHHAARNLGAGDACVIEPVGTQPYTGKAVTPIPVAYYREEGQPTVELVFARDFTLTYKNNIEPGMAELVIHGKGAYRGSRTTTFHIKRSV
jgi:hypothetical protein